MVTPENNIPSVLIGSAGTGTGFGAIVALRRTWSHSVRIIAMDINPSHLVTASLLVDGFEQVPLSSAPDFASNLIEIIRKHSVTTYLPLLPEEIAIAALLGEEGQLPDSFSLLAPTSAASRLCADKLSLCAILSSHGVSVPKSAEAYAPFGAEEYFLKPKNGTGSRGAQRVARVDLEASISGCPEQWLVQEICKGPEVTVDAFFDPGDDFVHVVCRERIEVKAGVSNKCRLFWDEQLREFAKRIADVLKLEGSFCFQVMKRGDDWVVIDINPRPGAATAMCVLTGNDFFAATFALKWGRDYRPFFRKITADEYVTRQYSEFLMGPIQHECGTGS